MSFLRHSAINFLGGVVPAVAVFLSIPVLLRELGADAYGALVLITSIVGYFGIIDVNATSGSVKYVAQHQARGEHDDVGRVISFGLLLYLAIGLVGGVALYAGADFLVDSVFRIDGSWRGQAVLALKVSAFAFFLVQLQQYLQSIPQALQRFDLSGQLDAVFGTLAPVSTIAVVLLGGSLVEIVAARLVVSLLHCGVLVRMVRSLLPNLRLRRPDRSTSSKMVKFSAFTYLQRLASVTYLNADKLLIGAHHTLGSLATYVIPYTLVSRMFSLLYRLMQGVFPMASALDAVGDGGLLRQRFLLAMRYVTYLNVCTCLMLATFAQELLHYWLRTAIDARAPVILIVVAYSLLAESLTHVPSLVNDGLGRPHISGIAAITRVTLSVAAAWVALTYSGIVALAISQLAVTVCVAAGFLWYVHRYSLPWKLSDVIRFAYLPSAWLLLIGSVGVVLRFQVQVLSGWEFLVMALGQVCFLLGFGWLFVLEPQHKQSMRQFVRQRLASV